MQGTFNIFFSFFFFAFASTTFSQSTIADFESTSMGVLFPRMTEIQRDNISSPPHSLIVYQTNETAGFYYNQGTAGAPNWRLLGGSEAAPCDFRIPIDTLPFHISASGSYVVIKELIGAAGLDGITIDTSNVTIDLNGFTLRSGGGAAGAGILVASPQQHIYIFNGNVQGWPSHGVFAQNASHSKIENIRARGNAADGINIGSNNIISNCQTTGNTFDGIDVNENSIISNCTASNNNDNGIETGRGCTVSSCISNENASNGFQTSNDNIIKYCSAYDNSNNGIVVSSACLVTDNTSTNNAFRGFSIGISGVVRSNIARTNGDHGYFINAECTVTNNIADNNSESGFHTGSSKVRFESNQSTTNATYGFNVQGLSDCIVIRNSSIDNTVANYNIVAGHTVGPFVGPNLIGVSNPFANISL